MGGGGGTRGDWVGSTGCEGWEGDRIRIGERAAVEDRVAGQGRAQGDWMADG